MSKLPVFMLWLVDYRQEEDLMKRLTFYVAVLAAMSLPGAAWAGKNETGNTNAADSVGVKRQEWTRMEPDASHNTLRDNFVWSERAPGTEKHQCIFYLKCKNQARLEEIVLQISDPTSPLYGKHLTKKEIDELTVDREGTEAVLKYIKDTGAAVVDQNAGSIKAEAPISVWESAFNTVFFIVKDTEKPSERLLRAHEYSLPSNIAKHVQFAGGTIQMPVKLHHGPVIIKKLPAEGEK